MFLLEVVPVFKQVGQHLGTEQTLHSHRAVGFFADVGIVFEIEMLFEGWVIGCVPRCLYETLQIWQGMMNYVAKMS